MKVFVSNLALVAAMLIGTGANAQTGPSAAASAADEDQPRAGGIEEIIVTAQKREESIQDTPLAISVLDGGSLAERGVKDFTTIARLAPDVSFQNNAATSNIGIRGVRSSASGPTNESPVAIHLDGVYLSSTRGLQGLFYDIDRLEILKGPQGTLYGRNATAGVINLISTRPKDYLGGYAEVEVGNYGLTRVEGALNVPLSDTLAVRAAGRLFERDPFYENGMDDADQSSGRVSMLWTPTAAFKLYLSADLSVSDRVGLRGAGTAVAAARNRSQNNPNAPIRPPFTNALLTGSPFGFNPVLDPIGLGPQREYQRVWGYNAQADYDLGFATATAQYGRRETRFEFDQISEGSPVPGATLPGYSAARARSKTDSVELRLASNGQTALQWVAGLFYFREDNGGSQCQRANFDTASPCTLTIDTPFQLSNSYAVFGDATWTPEALDNRLHVTVGVRYNHDNKEAIATTTSIFGVNARNGVLTDANGVGLNGAVVPDLLTLSADRVTGRFGLAFDVTEDNLIYASYSTGYQAGGFAFGSSPEFAPETIKAFEFGMKNQFFDRRLQVNLEFFHYDYTNQAVNVRVPSPTPPNPPFLDQTVISIGRLRYVGGALSIIAAPTPRDQFSLNLSVIPQAEFLDFVIPPRFQLGLPLNFEGRPTGASAGNLNGGRMPNVPRWAGNVSYSHTFDLFDGKLVAQGDAQFWGNTPFGEALPGTIQEFVRPSAVRGDLTLTYTFPDERLSLVGYVNNITDEATVLAAGGYNGNTGLIGGLFMPPRTFGGIVRFRY
ncbi:hypothetical protein IP81_15140 [Novosphingobium sp. AAP83]|uniref:TonB-dependent receptor n=1 Tax=Novosphingobium sp. AAP83 TaxID=1523425 RepID=UPI0006B98D5F|nr:TonB-dependent receptor [Novosphingobium sp. AAP83]KPF90506.1 hypothetical protein IP81_15140 [Novosphingobium sp. AAP83]